MELSRSTEQFVFFVQKGNLHRAILHSNRWRAACATASPAFLIPVSGRLLETALAGVDAGRLGYTVCKGVCATPQRPCIISTLDCAFTRSRTDF